MVKILSQAGNSLADVYDVEGSIAGIATLETRELPIVHEMGATVFSERLTGSILRVATGDILQNATWDITTSDVGAVSFSRVLGCLVFTDSASRVSNVSVHIRDPLSGREVPIFAWDLNEAALNLRMVDDGAAVATFEALSNALNVATLPSFLIGSQQRNRIDTLVFRGLMTGFGAGTVFARALIYNIFSETEGISSRGLPVPGW